MRIVLTAPATEMSEYDGNPVIAFGSGFPKPFPISLSHLRKNFYRTPPVREDYSVLYAPLGLRRIESSLMNSGLFKEKDIIVVHPNNLEEVINKRTSVIGVSVKDPLGLGYVSLTYSTLIGLGESINKLEFLDLMSRIRRLRKKYKFRVVVGGPGVWQFKFLGKPTSSLGIDTVIEGEGEIVAPEVFTKHVRREYVESYVKAKITPVELIPCIVNASIYGAIEITRGCGRGCMFCTPTMQLKRDLPLDKISRDIEVNLRNNQTKILVVTEDLFLYGARIPWEPRSDPLLKLIDTITKYKNMGLKSIQITHMNLACVRYRRDLFRQIAERLYEFAWYRLGKEVLNTVEVGIESGSSRIMNKYMRGKTLPFKPDEWFETVLDSLIFMEEHNWIALGTIIVGLPGETPEDAYETLKLVESIREHGLRTLLIPLLFVPLGGCVLQDQPIRSFNDLCDTQLSIFYTCWRHNIKVYGPDFFANYKLFKKTVFKILARIYMATVARKYRWRRVITHEIYREINRVLSNGVGGND